MADFFDQVESALQKAESIFGTSFTLGTSLTTFKGVWTAFEEIDPVDLKKKAALIASRWNRWSATW
jgi:hypothetical protein